MVTVLVQNGTLKRGDTLIVGEHYGRIKSMYDFTGKEVSVAPPSTPVSVSGLKGIPSAGDQFYTVKDEKTARKEVARIEEENRKESQHGGSAHSLEAFFANLQEGESKTLNLIIKADVQGSLEPIVNSLEKLRYDDITVDIILASTGNINETDVMLASASDAIIMGFNVGSDAIARTAAASERVEIKNYTIIYKLIEDVDKALKGLLDPVFEEVVIGRAEVRAVFRIRGVGQIAGSYMRTGVAKRNSNARLIRNNKLMHTDKVSSLKHLQDNVREVKTGFEFGVNLANWEDYQEGDIIEFFTTKEVPVD
jgi:translation initiation factor IF-2